MKKAEKKDEEIERKKLSEISNALLLMKLLIKY